MFRCREGPYGMATLLVNLHNQLKLRDIHLKNALDKVTKSILQKNHKHAWTVLNGL